MLMVTASSLYETLDVTVNWEKVRDGKDTFIHVYDLTKHDVMVQVYMYMT